MVKSRGSILIFVLLAPAAMALWASPAQAGGGGCLGVAPSDGSSTTVELKDICFTPTVTHVASGSEITWVNRDDVDHVVVGVGESWGSGKDLVPGSKVTYRFEGNGVYVYACWIHPGMIGAVVVGDGSGPADLSSVTTVAAAATSAPAAPAIAPVTSADRTGSGGAIMAGVAGLIVGASVATVALTRRKRSLAV